MHTPAGERNFHIFHQILCRPDGALGAASRLPLAAPVSYAYLARGGCLHAPAIDDAARCVQVEPSDFYPNPRIIIRLSSLMYSYVFYPSHVEFEAALSTLEPLTFHSKSK